MNNTNQTECFIRGLVPHKDHEISITVTDREFVDARKFRDQYLTHHHPMCEDYTEEQLLLLSAAFLSIADRLPIFSYDLICWTDETCMFAGRAAVREFAEKKLGMMTAGEWAKAKGRCRKGRSPKAA
jgi:hypothetical protein